MGRSHPTPRSLLFPRGSRDQSRGQRSPPPFLMYTMLPKGRTGGEVDFLLLWAHGRPSSHGFLSRNPTKAVLSQDDPASDQLQEGQELRAHLEGEREGGQWLTLRRPCNNTGTEPQLDPVATLNATSEYLSLVFASSISV